jgi:hypothetical protein
LQVALVPDFFEQTTDIGFVLFRHGESPFFETRTSYSPEASWV